MRQEEISLKQIEARHKIPPSAPFAASYTMGWKGLQADRRRHAGTVPDFRKNRVKVRKPLEEIGRRAH